MTGVWRKALVYLGLVEEEDELEPLPEVHEPPQLETVRPIRPPESPQTPSVRPMQPAGGEQTHAVAPVAPVAMPQVRIHVVEPRMYNDAPEIGDKLKVDQPVLMNLHQVEREGDAVKLLAFTSGLTYGLSGGMKKVAEKVFLLTPPNVEVSAEETQRIMNERGFFNQF